MAESIARHDAGDVIDASSAGLTPLGSVPELTKQTLAANGHSSDELLSKPVTRELWHAADIVINMSGIPKWRAFADPSKVEDWAVQDPYGNDPALYQTIHEEIERRVGELAQRLRHAAPHPGGSPAVGKKEK